MDEQQVGKRYGHLVYIGHLLPAIEDEKSIARCKCEYMQCQISGLDNIKEFARSNGGFLDCYRHRDVGVYRKNLQFLAFF